MNNKESIGGVTPGTPSFGDINNTAFDFFIKQLLQQKAVTGQSCIIYLNAINYWYLFQVKNE